MPRNELNPDIPVIEISFHDTKTIEKDGEVFEVAAFIPECCREGWDSCKHVVKRQKPIKRNVGL